MDITTKNIEKEKIALQNKANKREIALELVKAMIKPDDISYVEQNANKVAKAFDIIYTSLK